MSTRTSTTLPPKRLSPLLLRISAAVFFLLAAFRLAGNFAGESGGLLFWIGVLVLGAGAVVLVLAGMPAGGTPGKGLSLVLVAPLLAFGVVGALESLAGAVEPATLLWQLGLAALIGVVLLGALSSLNYGRHRADRGSRRLSLLGPVASINRGLPGSLRGLPFMLLAGFTLSAVVGLASTSFQTVTSNLVFIATSCYAAVILLQTASEYRKELQLRELLAAQEEAEAPLRTIESRLV